MLGPIFLGGNEEDHKRLDFSLEQTSWEPLNFFSKLILMEVSCRVKIKTRHANQQSSYMIVHKRKKYFRCASKTADHT